MFSSALLTIARKRRGLSRSALYRSLVKRGFTRCRSLIDRFETGRSVPSANDASMLAQVLEVPLSALFDSPNGESQA